MILMTLCSDQMSLVLWQLKSWIDNNFFAHFPVEVRFVKQNSNALLSLSRDSDVCYINIIMYRYMDRLIN